MITCQNCKYLMFSDCYGECAIAERGIVKPDDTCGKAESKYTREDLARLLKECDNGNCDNCERKKIIDCNKEILELIVDQLTEYFSFLRMRKRKEESKYIQELLNGFVMCNLCDQTNCVSCLWGYDSPEKCTLLNLEVERVLLKIGEDYGKNQF